jgi:hypothetical protein
MVSHSFISAMQLSSMKKQSSYNETFECAEGVSGGYCNVDTDVDDNGGDVEEGGGGGGGGGGRRGFEIVGVSDCCSSSSSGCRIWLRCE